VTVVVSESLCVAYCSTCLCTTVGAYLLMCYVMCDIFPEIWLLQTYVPDNNWRSW